MTENKFSMPGISTCFVLVQFLALQIVNATSPGLSGIPAATASDQGSPAAYVIYPGPNLAGKFKIVFYNVENLFDTFNDPEKDDDAFTPYGDRRWTPYRLNEKINNLYKAIAAAGGLEIPAIIGLCEVENRLVLEMLTRNTGLRSAGYSIIHRNSADRRGIDVGILYRPEEFILLDKKFTGIMFPFDPSARTREIVYLKGVAGINDTMHIFVNHWPSRWGGQAASEPYRNYVATILRSLADSVFQAHPLANIIIMGDFNDEPEDASVRRYLGAGLDYDNPVPGQLYNISYSNNRNRQGSCKYQGEWFLFDQFIVSGALIDGTSSLQTCPGSARVFVAEFLLIPDPAWHGYKPFRSYEGFRHTGGFSDHLPIVLDLWW
jgi:predicted extracellular nuclease